MVWVIAFGELFFGDLWCVVWGYGGMRTHFSLLNPQKQTENNPSPRKVGKACLVGASPVGTFRHLPQCELLTAFMADGVGWMRVTDCVYVKNGSKNGLKVS